MMMVSGKSWTVRAAGVAPGGCASISNQVEISAVRGFSARLFLHFLRASGVLVVVFGS